MARVWSMPIDLNDPEDRRVATWLAAQSRPAEAVKRLILQAAAGKEPPGGVIEATAPILREVRTLRAELKQAQASLQSNPSYEDVLYELRALRADLARVGPQELGKVAPPPEDPESARRLDTLFDRRQAADSGQ
jgi:hypothetical protein